MTNASSGATPAINRFDLHSSGPMRLGSATGPVGFDQRTASIEVHFDVPIRLTPENVLAIVGPDLACEEPEMIDFAVSLDADLQPHPSDEDGPSVRRRQVSGRASTAEARAGDRRQRGGPSAVRSLSIGLRRPYSTGDTAYLTVDRPSWRNEPIRHPAPSPQ